MPFTHFTERYVRQDTTCFIGQITSEKKEVVMSDLTL